MSTPDLNLLVTLEALLAEGSVARAGRRLRLSPSAMSRALSRLRKAIGDPLLVRSGRALVPTPRALELRGRVGTLVQEAEAALRPVTALDPKRLVRTFTLRTREGFVENFAPDLVARIGAEAPGVRLCFVQKPDRESASLRDGSVDLETGVLGQATNPEISSQALFVDRFIGVVRKGHQLSKGAVTAARYASCRHIGVSPRGPVQEPIDDALRQLGLERQVTTLVDSFSAALALARSSDLVVSVPERHTGDLRAGMHSFALPIPTPEMAVSLLWHHRLDADPAHCWLRRRVLDLCGATKGTR